MRNLLLLTILLWFAVQAMAAQSEALKSNDETAGVALTITRTRSRLDISGNVSSAAHETILRNSVARFFGVEDSEFVSFELHDSTDTPAGWALITDMVLRALATTLSATAEISASSIRVRGVTTTAADWAAAIQRVEIALLDGMTLDYDVVTVSEDEHFQLLCRRQILQFARDNHIQFILSGAELRTNALPTLDAMVEVAVDCPQLKIRVTGHTDSSGDEAANIALSRARADAVIKYMVGRGLSVDRLEAVGAGSSEPAVANSDARSRRLNRRVEFTLLPP